MSASPVSSDAFHNLFEEAQTLRAENTRLQAALAEAEKRADRSDEYRDALSDLTRLHGEDWAIGGGPGFKEREAKAWDVANELVRNEP